MNGSVQATAGTGEIAVVREAEQVLIDAEFAAIVAASWPPDDEPAGRAPCGPAEHRPARAREPAAPWRRPPGRPARPRQRPVQRPPPHPVIHAASARGR